MEACQEVARLGERVSGELNLSASHYLECFSRDGAGRQRASEAPLPHRGQPEDATVPVLVAVYFLPNPAPWAPSDGGQLLLWPEQWSDPDGRLPPAALDPVGDRIIYYRPWMETECRLSFAPRTAVVTYFYKPDLDIQAMAFRDLLQSDFGHLPSEAEAAGAAGEHRRGVHFPPSPSPPGGPSPRAAAASPSPRHDWSRQPSPAAAGGAQQASPMSGSRGLPPRPDWSQRSSQASNASPRPDWSAQSFRVSQTTPPPVPNYTPPPAFRVSPRGQQPSPAQSPNYASPPAFRVSPRGQQPSPAQSPSLAFMVSSPVASPSMAFRGSPTHSPHRSPVPRTVPAWQRGAPSSAPVARVAEARGSPQRAPMSAFKTRRF